MDGAVHLQPSSAHGLMTEKVEPYFMLSIAQRSEPKGPEGMHGPWTHETPCQQCCLGLSFMAILAMAIIAASMASKPPLVFARQMSCSSFQCVRDLSAETSA